jgi:hypothetical protein
VTQQSYGFTASNLSQSSFRDTCRAPLNVVASGDEVRLSWPAATCGQNTTSGGSTTCRASQGALVCGAETYRRE